jgi:transposase
MRYVGGDLQARFMAGIRGLDREQCLVVPVDVGKSAALALVADHYGEVVVAPFEFGLTESGLGFLLTSVARAEAARAASVVRVGVEAAGHYHRTLVARLRAEGLDVVELNPGRSRRLDPSSCCGG